VLNATLAAGKAAPGEKVGITATLANKGNSNGTSKVTLYVNGQEVESQGVVLASGEKRTVNFTLSRNEPGTYSVYVNSVPAGNFTVDIFTNNDVLIYSIIIMFTLGIIGILYLLARRRSA
jgi:uncharacterized membrane protein